MLSETPAYCFFYYWTENRGVQAAKYKKKRSHVHFENQYSIFFPPVKVSSDFTCLIPLMCFCWHFAIRGRPAWSVRMELSIFLPRESYAERTDSLGWIFTFHVDDNRGMSARCCCSVLLSSTLLLRTCTYWSSRMCCSCQCADSNMPRSIWVLLQKNWYNIIQSEL